MTQASERSPLAASIMAGQAPPPLLKAAAKAILPIPQEEQIEILVFLRNHADPEIRLSAKESLVDIKIESILPLLESYDFDADVFVFFGQVFKGKANVLITLVRNTHCTTNGLTAIAHQAKDPKVLDVIITNHSKIFEDPDILTAVMENPTCTLDLSRRILDMINQFMQSRVDLKMQARRLMAKFTGTAPDEMPEPVAPAKPAPVAPVEKTPATDAVASTTTEEVTASEAATSEQAAAPTAEDLDWREEGEKDEFGLDDFGEPGDEPGIDDFSHLDGEPGEEEQEEVFEEEEVLTLQQKLLDMNVPQKVQLALKGTKEARTLLIKDPNKLVQNSVMDSPKITDSEIDFISKQRNVTEDVLRKISKNRDWMKRYTVVYGLVFNPKTPIQVGIRLVSRLTVKDIRMLSRSKMVPDPVRRQAKKMYEAKTRRD